jgi:hypothetical protein
LLVAAAIAVLIMMTAIPYAREVRKSPLVRGVNAVVEACRQARIKAILSDRPMEVEFREGGRVIVVQPASNNRPSFIAIPGINSPTLDTAQAEERPTSSQGFEATLDDRVAFAWLLVNGRGFVANVIDERELRVRFFPNGTCDALDAKLEAENRDAQRITLDIMTGQPTVEAVP